MSKARKTIMAVRGTEIAVLSYPQGDYISLTDMLKAKDGDFFISDWLRNRNTVEFLGIWESVYNPDFNYGEFAVIRSRAGLNNYKISVRENTKYEIRGRFPYFPGSRPTGHVDILPRLTEENTGTLPLFPRFASYGACSHPTSPHRPCNRKRRSVPARCSRKGAKTQRTCH